MTAAAPGPGPRRDHALLVEAVRAAGALAMAYRGRDFERWEKRPGDPVTAADLAVDAQLKQALHGARPGYGWLSEESEDDPGRLAASHVWIVDPIDGTRAFIDGRPEFTVSAALAVDGAPAAAAVFHPATGELFDAVAGGGARRDGVPIRVGDAGSLAGARLLVSRTEMRRAGWLERLPETRATPISSMAYKLALVASGRFDATVTLWPKNEWDVAAADLLVREAGGRVTDADGAGFAYNRADPGLRAVVAAGPRLHEALLDRLAGIDDPAVPLA